VEPATLKLPKAERVSGKKLPDMLFKGGKGRSMSAFPLRMVYMRTECGDSAVPAASILVSVPKRHQRLAVRRNRIKRQIREAYRKNKGIILGRLGDNTRHKVMLAFIWQDSKLHESTEVELKIRNLLTRLSEKL